MSEIGDRQDHNQNQKTCLCITLGLYSFLLLISLWKLAKSFFQHKFWGLIRAKIFYIIISTVIVCNFKLVRILWIADIFFKYRGFVYNLLDVLPCSTFTLLGTTFALFWVEMYINTSVQLSDDQKRKYLIATISAYVAMNFLNYLSHIMVVVQYYDDDDVLLLDKMWENLVIVNVVFFVVTTILLAVAGQLLASHIKEIFNGPTGDFVSRRIRYVSVFCGLCFTIKSIMPLLLFSFNYSSSKYQGIDDLFILLYYGLMEIIPISILLILIKVSRPTTDEDDDDLLPEGLFPNYENSLTSSEGTSPRLLLRKSLISVGDESITQAFSERFTSATFSSFI